MGAWRPPYRYQRSECRSMEPMDRWRKPPWSQLASPRPSRLQRQGTARWRAVRAVTCCTMRCPRQAAALAPPCTQGTLPDRLPMQLELMYPIQFPPPPARPQHTRHCLTTSLSFRYTSRQAISAIFYFFPLHPRHPIVVYLGL